MSKFEIKEGDIVQLTPEVKNRAFTCCLMVVTEPKPWGAQGYVQSLGDARDAPGGQAYYRATWAEMTPTGGRVQWEQQ
ncbi:MAG TPA: hypothetical protein VNV16_11825 [Methylibium sp.]|nr:hypothetical protein [Methylibium sp.]